MATTLNAGRAASDSGYETIHFISGRLTPTRRVVVLGTIPPNAVLIATLSTVLVTQAFDGGNFISVSDPTGSIQYASVLPGTPAGYKPFNLPAFISTVPVTIVASYTGAIPTVGAATVVLVFANFKPQAAQIFAAGPPESIPDLGLAADRITTWNPGLMSTGGIPNRTTISTTLSPLSVGSDNFTQVQDAINACPVGQVVQLAAGTWTFAATNPIRITKGITLRGAGAGVTILQKLNGATNGSFTPGPSAAPVIFIQTFGPALGGPTNLTANAAKGATSVTVASATGFAAGQLMRIDELSGAAFRTDPQGRGQVWASADFRVTWNKFNPSSANDDFAPGEFPAEGNLGSAWCRADRPTSEIKEIVSVVGNVITFATPLHFSYRTAQSAQVDSFSHVEGAGVENLTLTNGDNGNIIFAQAKRCWVKGIESKQWLNEGINFIQSYQCEMRDSYLHDTVWPIPGGGGYAISFAFASSDVLIENCISVRANKVMVARCSGAGSVVGYCYMDMGFIDGSILTGQNAWIEIGLNASHMVGPHHVLFEGNYGQNADSDKTHGSSVYMTYFRNHLRGIRAQFLNQGGESIDDATQPGNGPRRCAGPAAYSYNFNFVGNVMGAAGQMAGFIYETTFTSGTYGIWMMGWDDFEPYPIDPNVKATSIRDGNFDHLTGTQQWHNGAPRALPNSLYLSAKPAFFGANAWPWVNPVTGATASLPAKVRFDAGTPNVVL